MKAETAEKNVLVKVISSAGHDEYPLTPAEAVARIHAMCSNEGKWAYVDGVHIANTAAINVDMLRNAEDITLTNQLVGG